MLTYQVFDAIEAMQIWRGLGFDSATIDLYGVRNWGLFSMQVENTGDGALQLQYEISVDNVTYVTPSAAVDICSGFTKTSGPGSGSTDIFVFSPLFARYIQFKATASGGASVILLAKLAVQ